MKSQRLPTISVAVCAYNEEGNIYRFLSSVLGQDQTGFILKEIIVVTDGCTDKTVEIVRSLQKKHSIIKITESKTRVGKSTHLNDIYKRVLSDYLVQSDADVVFSHTHVIRDMIMPLQKDRRVGMCGGNPTPLPASTFWEHVASVAFEPYQAFRSTVRGGDNALSAVGQILAYRRELLRTIHIPSDMVTNDLFTYFCCLSTHWNYKYVASGIVYFQSPKALRDIIKQNTRFKTGHNRMYTYFPKQMVDYEMSIPRLAYVRAIVGQLLKHPIYSILYYTINLCSKIRANRIGATLTAAWPIATTTKRHAIRMPSYI